MTKILLVEDEKALSDAVAAVLRHFGYDIDCAYDGLEALEKTGEAAYDCIVMDIMMPKMDGIEALRRMRSGGDVTPVILLTAKTEVEDRIVGLDAGADDYVAKPFAMGELLARIRSLTRRASSYTPSRVTLGHVSLNTEEQELTAASSIRLGSKETKLLKLLMLNEGKSFTREDLYTHVWKDEPDVGEEIVWMYISFLREKMEAVHGDLEIEGGKEGPFSLVKKQGHV